MNSLSLGQLTTLKASVTSTIEVAKLHCISNSKRTVYFLESS